MGEEDEEVPTPGKWDFRAFRATERKNDTIVGKCAQKKRMGEKPAKTERWWGFQKREHPHLLHCCEEEGGNLFWNP